MTFTPARDAARQRTFEPAVAGLTEAQIWEHFAAACRADRQTPAVPIETVMPTMALLDAARQSSADGRAVELDLK